MNEYETLDMSTAALLRVKAIWIAAQQYPPLKDAIEEQRESDALRLKGHPAEPVAVDGMLVIEALREAGADDETVRYFFRLPRGSRR